MKVLGQKWINIQNLKLNIDKRALNIRQKTKLSSRPKTDFSSFFEPKINKPCVQKFANILWMFEYEIFL